MTLKGRAKGALFALACWPAVAAQNLLPQPHRVRNEITGATHSVVWGRRRASNACERLWEQTGTNYRAAHLFLDTRHRPTTPTGGGAMTSIGHVDAVASWTEHGGLTG